MNEQDENLLRGLVSRQEDEITELLKYKRLWEILKKDMSDNLDFDDIVRLMETMEHE